MKMVNDKESCGGSPYRVDAPPSLFSIDGYPDCGPAAGWRYGSSLNNAGENGNYWSATPNESDTQNAYNLNFNSGNHNVDWNNRNNGQSVRPVSELTVESESIDGVRRFSISKDRLLADIFRAYKHARKHKRGRTYQLEFEFNLEENLVDLRDDIFNRLYRPLPSDCFVIHDPKMREVFAANFRDRIVHHLFYDYTHLLFERTFIHDSYSCIENRGTHFGIERLKHHIRSVSAGYSRPCYILKIDIRGYFMSIDRGILLRLCRSTLDKMKNRRADASGRLWSEMLDYGLVDYLLETIILADPMKDCRMLGNPDDWRNLPHEKSLFFAARDCGLPIGNLSSQLFSNVYMNVLDQYVKRELGCRHYGRYVDDAYIVSDDKNLLKSLIPSISVFLHDALGLSLHPDKTRIYDARQGVEFLGAYLKPFRTYIASDSLLRIKSKMLVPAAMYGRDMQSSINSYLGVLSHYDSYCIRRVLFGHIGRFSDYGRFSRDWLSFTPYDKLRLRDFM